MSFLPLRRAALVAATCLTSLLLAACGSGDVYSAFTPARVLVLGDGPGNAITGSVSGQIASRYAASVSYAPSAGTTFAFGDARVATKPNQAGSATALTVSEQVAAALAAGVQSTDLVVVSAGVADVIAEGQAVIAGTQTSAQATTNITAAAAAFDQQLRTLVNAGVQRIVIAGTWNLGRSPWASATGQATMLESLSKTFNQELLKRIADLGKNVLYVDAELQMNLITGSPSSYSLSDASKLLCTSVDAGAGIGVGTGQVNAALCDSTTLDGSLTASTTLFADRIHFTAAGAVLLGNYAYERIRLRW